MLHLHSPLLSPSLFRRRNLHLDFRPPLHLGRETRHRRRKQLFLPVPFRSPHPLHFRQKDLLSHSCHHHIPPPPPPPPPRLLHPRRDKKSPIARVLSRPKYRKTTRQLLSTGVKNGSVLGGERVSQASLIHNPHLGNRVLDFGCGLSFKDRRLTPEQRQDEKMRR